MIRVAKIIIRRFAILLQADLTIWDLLANVRLTIRKSMRAGRFTAMSMTGIVMRMFAATEQGYAKSVRLRLIRLVPALIRALGISKLAVLKFAVSVTAVLRLGIRAA